MSFQFIQNPLGAGLDNASLIESSLDQPMSLGSTFFDQAKGGILESFGLGTAIREGSLPAEAPTKPELMITPPEGTGPVLVPDTPQMRRRRTVFESVNPELSLQARPEAPQELQKRQEEAGALSEDAYKASPFFRKDIPWQNGMTAERAAALAEQDDYRKVRQFYASKRPITSFFGNLGGQALDPINYIPVAGEVVAAANVARFGRVAGRALTSSIDAAANTAIAGLATAPIRQSLGDDVSWQSTISQVAMAAVIGGAFGAVAGRFGRATPTELRAEAESKLATLQNVQEARVALNDALDGMINKGEVEVSPASADVVARVADLELPKVVIERMAREADTAAFERLDNLNRTFEINDAEIRRLQGETMDNRRFGPVRAAMIEADRLAERVRNADDALQKAATEKQRQIETTRAEKAREDLRRHLATIDDNAVQQLEDVDAALAARRTANEPVARERAELTAKAAALRSEAQARYWAERPAPAVRRAAEASNAQAAPAPVIDPAPAEAMKRVGRPEAPREAAEQYRVNPETGEFAEQGELDQLIAAGRITEEDRAALDSADETLKSANAYGEAVKAFANCAV
ncbi:hypothetical protein ABCW43_00060 [Neorhizobium sp. IRAMC:178]|uniref:hypothetical protein n=1 Tax=Neorhizobium tunisiense TaxID=3144793 RepID=UPI0031F6AE14